ncbi:hypothetical protein [Paralcaligenes ginsengisoli]
MNIATLDLPVSDTKGFSFAQFAFTRPAPLDNIDTIVWNPGALLPQMKDQIEQIDPAVLSVRGSESLLAMSRYWRKELDSLLARGGSVVVLSCPPKTVGVHTLQEIMPYDIYEPLLPLRVATRAYDGGESICHAGDPFHTLFRRIGHMLRPTATLDSYSGIPILQNNARQTLAVYCNPIPGRIMILPALAHKTLEQPEMAVQFFSALQESIDRLGHTANAGNASWLGSYRSVAEETLYAQRADYFRQMDGLQKKIDLLQADIDQYEFFKQLLGGEGRGVYTAVAELFRRKGAFVQPDWLENNLLLVELSKNHLAVKIRLPGETVDEAYFRKLEQSRQRIAEYFGRPVLTLLADCSGNGVPLPERNPNVDEAAMARRHGCLYAEGIHLYGWHIGIDNVDPDAWAAHLEQKEGLYLEHLRQTVNANLGQTPLKTSYKQTGPTKL